MLRLKTFGALAIVRDGELAEDVRIQRRQLSLLVVLATDGGASRDRLVGLFWPDRDSEKARHLLDQALYAARRALGADVVLEGQASLQLNPAVLGSDIADFRQALERGDLEGAVSVYAGPFLDAVYLDGVPDFEQWSHARRTAFAKDNVDALLKLTERAMAAADYPSAVSFARLAAASDPLSGQVVRVLMTALCSADDQTAALNAFRVHAALVREELEAEPDATVLALAEDVRAGRVRAPAAPAAAAPAAKRAPAAAAPPDRGPLPDAVAPVGAAPSVAVLPFVSISTESGDNYFSNGMTEAIINALARLSGLRVCARTTVFAFKDTALDVTEIGRRLGVRTVVEGTVIRDGDRVRVSAKLINVTDGSHLWLGQYDRELVNVFAIQDEIAQAIAQTLQISLLGRGVPPRTAIVTAAYERYLRGRHFRDRRSPESLRRALRYYQEAIQIEPRYALAIAAEADTYAVALAYGAVPPAVAIPRIRDCAARAIEIDPTIAEPHAALGAVAAMCERDWKSAERHFDRSFALNPQYETAHMWYANYLLAPLGRFEEALTSLARAHRLDLLSPVINCSIGMILFFAHRFDEAAKQFQGTLEFDPTFLYANYFLGRTEVMRGHFAAAIEALERTVALSGGAAVARSALGYAHARGGDETEARAIVERLESPAPGELVSAFDPAFVRLGLLEHDKAIAGFARAAEQREPFAIWLGVQPEAEALLGRPDFDAILQRMDLPTARHG